MAMEIKYYSPYILISIRCCIQKNKLTRRRGSA